jgi:hypothetical protein
LPGDGHQNGWCVGEHGAVVTCVTDRPRRLDFTSRFLSGVGMTSECQGTFGHFTGRFSGRVRRRPAGVRTGGMSATTAWNVVVVSLTLAAVTTAVSGTPPSSQTSCSLVPGLPRSTGFAPTWSPHAGPARSWGPRSPGSSPAGPARRGGPRPPGEEHRRRRRWPTRSAGASRSPASRSRVPEPAGAARGWRCGP